MSAPRNVRRHLVPVVQSVPRPDRLRLPDEEPVRWWHWVVGAIVVIVLSLDGWN